MESIKRKSLLYKTGVEYGDYTINHVQGCAHGCKFPCYAMMMAKRFGRVKNYDEWRNPKIVENAEDLLLKELPHYKSDIKSVQLCFTTDPFMYGYPEVSELSIKLIKIINSYNIKCIILSKGVLPKSLINLSDINEFGITLVSLDESFRKSYEPFTAPYTERINSLKFLHDNGFKTWISMEPYPTPNIINQNIYDILEAVKFTDKIIFGKLNYNTLVSKYPDHNNFYNQMVNTVINYCDDYQIEYYIKKGTLPKQI